MTTSKNNRSLFAYTALIFIVAIIMIIIAFFGQSNLEKNQPLQSEEAMNTITEKAAQLSEDNRLLLEENRLIRTENTALSDEVQLLNDEKKQLQQEIENNNSLLEIYNYLYKGYKTKARTLLSELSKEELTETQLKFYNILLRKSK